MLKTIQMDKKLLLLIFVCFLEQSASQDHDDDDKYEYKDPDDDDKDEYKDTEDDKKDYPKEREKPDQERMVTGYPSTTGKPTAYNRNREPKVYRYEIMTEDDEVLTEEKEIETYEYDSNVNNHYCPPCLVWKKCGYPCQHQCHPKKKNCRCRPGCFCPGNLKLNNDGQCVSPFLCPKKNHETCCFGKRYTTCGSQCAETCGEEVCTLECNEGCFCLKGTKIIDGVCQPPYKCRTCSAGKVHQKCGRKCDEICGCVSPVHPSVFCEEGCFCPKGKRLVKGVCRPENECHLDDRYPFYK